MERELAQHRSTLLELPTGCHRAGQLVLMHDGSLRKVEDVRYGDMLMGPDGAPRRVLRLARGRDEMVEIRPTRGASWVVNIDHVLTLVRTRIKRGDLVAPSQRGGQLVDVTVREWMGWSRTAKHLHKLLRVGAEFPYRPDPMISPYVFGVLLGDGSLGRRVGLTTEDREIAEASEREARRHGLVLKRVSSRSSKACPQYNFTKGRYGADENVMLTELRRLGVNANAGHKFVPDEYKLGSRWVRLEVLAGLIDTDGHLGNGGYDFVSKSWRLADDAAFIARSLGLAAYVAVKRIMYKGEPREFYRVSISGRCDIVPCRLPRKRAARRGQKKDALRTGFTVHRTGTVEDYYGFALDGDQRYLLGDFTVTHNTGKTVCFTSVARTAAMSGDRTLVIVHRDELLRQARRKCEDVGIYADTEKGRQRASLHARVVIASVQSLRGARLARFPRDHFARIVIDEAHHAVASGYRAVLDHFEEAKVLGVTATPRRADGVGLGEVFETVAYRYELRDAIRDGWLVPLTARRVVLEGVDLSGVKTRAGDLAQDQLSAVMAQERAIRGVVDALLEQTGSRKTVVFGVDVAHAQAIAAELDRRRPGCARAVSGTTDDDERERLLWSFEHGEFQFLCNCALLTEGWDCPSVSCVAIVRPTKSTGLFVQMVGRGTRLLGATYAESCRNGKPEVLLLAFGGNAGKHRLVSPVDVLQGDLPDDLRAELDRLLGHSARRLEDVIAQATGTVLRQRVDTAAAAKVRWHAEQIDPFVGEPQGELGEIRPGWHEALATSSQIAALGQFGIDADKLPARFTMADATRLIARLSQRRARGLCSLRQARRLASYGLDPRAITFARASQLFGLLKSHGWSATALIGQPEASEEFHRKLAAARAKKLEVQRKKLEASGGLLAEGDGFEATDELEAGEAGAA